MTHGLSGFYVPVYDGWAFTLTFWAAGIAWGRLFRFMPGFFALVYNPDRGWLYAICTFGFGFLMYEVRQIESFIVYGMVMREGTWVLLWTLAMAYGVGVGYSGHAWYRKRIPVRSWRTGKRETDEEVERMLLERDESRDP